MKRLIDIVMRYPRRCLTLLALITLAIGSASRNLEFNASVKSFIIQDDPDYASYRDYRAKFGQDEILVISFEDKDIFTPRNIDAIRRLTGKIEELDNIYDVRSLTNVEYMRNDGESFEVVPVIDEDLPENASEYLAAQKKVATENRILCQDIISKDAKKTSILVTLNTMEEGYRYTKEIQELDKIVMEESDRLGARIYIAGERYLDHRFVEYMHRDLKVFIPMTCIVLGGLLFLIFRTVRDTAIGLTAISVCLVCIMGLIPLTGWEMNSVTAGLPSLVLCIAVTDVVHILHRYRRIRRDVSERRPALLQTLKETALPCLLTSLTTAIGFGSLILNNIHPIRGFGLLAALGVSICFVVCIIIVPALLLLWKEGDEVPDEAAHVVSARAMGRLADLLVKRKNVFAGWAATILVVTAIGIFLVRVQTNRTRYLKPGSDVHQSIDFIDRNLAGTTELDVSIESGKEGTFKEPKTLQKVEALAAYLRAMPDIDKVISINDFIKDMNQAFHEDRPEFYRLPDTRDNVADFLLLYSMSGNRNELDRYVDYPYSRTRLSVRTSEQNSERLDAMIARINTYLGKHFGGSLDAKLESVALSNNNVFHYLVKGLMTGLGLAIVLVGLVMCINFRSAYVGAVSMIPNIIPVIACLGVMGWCGTWLDIATAMTFSIALGISVDDTIHLMSRFRMELQRCGHYEEALRNAMVSVGPALVETSIIISGGFLILVLASLKMNMMFGLLCAFIMLVALVCDLVVTPLCLLAFRPFKLVAAAEDPANSVSPFTRKRLEIVTLKD